MAASATRKQHVVPGLLAGGSSRRAAVRAVLRRSFNRLVILSSGTETGERGGGRALPRQNGDLRPMRADRAASESLDPGVSQASAPSDGPAGANPLASVEAQTARHRTATALSQPGESNMAASGLARRARQLRPTLNAPVTLQIEVTTACPNRCPHCYRGSNAPLPPDTHISPARIDTLIRDAAAAGVLNIVLTGGEPLSAPATVVAAIEACRAVGISCHLNSTLIGLDNEVLADAIAGGPFRVLVSLAGPHADLHDAMMGRRGAYEETLNGIAALREAGIPFAVNMVVTQRNHHAVLDTGLLAHSLGARAFSATKASAAPWQSRWTRVQPTADQVRSSLDALAQVRAKTGLRVEVLECYPRCLTDDPLHDSLLRRTCTAGVTSAVVDPSGDMRPCTHAQTGFGNVFELSIAEVFASMTPWRDGSLLPEGCRGCATLAVCSGGCRIEAACAGDIAGMDPYATAPRPQRPVVPPTVDLGARVAAYRDVQSRPEAFGVLLVGRGRVAMVDAQAGALFRRLQAHPLTVPEAASEFNVSPDDVAGVVRGLTLRGLVHEVHDDEVL